MAMDLTSLPQYVEQNKLPLVKKAVLGAKSASLFNVQTDIKGSATINLLGVTPSLQAGGCGWNDAGSAKMTQRTIETKFLKVNQSFCDKDFLNYYTNYAVKVGVGRETLPFEEYFTSAIVDSVKESVEKMIWQGDNTANQFKGILPILAAEGEVIAVEPAEGTSVYGAIKEVYAAIPEEILDKATIFVGADTYRSFIMEMVEKNFYHYDGGSVEAKEFVLPATNTKVVAVNGLNGTKKIVAGDAANFYLGCDMLNDMETFDLWYSQDNREYRLAIQFNAGVQVAFPSEVVVATMA
jgi:hypothetical protein